MKGGATIRLPYKYDLVELDPEISFVTPENLTESNTQIPLSLHARDIGIGFGLHQLSWDWPSNNSTFPADNVWGISTDGSTHDLTPHWNGSETLQNLTLREVWVNSTLPNVEQWFNFHAQISDASGRTAEPHLSVLYDVTSPVLVVSGVPWISNSQELEVSIHTEPGATLTIDGTEFPTSESGIANYTIQLEEALMGVDPTSAGSTIFYHNNESNEFTIESTDSAGNSAKASLRRSPLWKT